MRIMICLAVLLFAAKSAAFEVTPRGSVTVPVSETNSAIEAIVILCRRDFVIGVDTPARRLRPKRDLREEEALFDTLFGKATAVVDGERFNLGVGGANDDRTIYVFAEDNAGLLQALYDGESLALLFDILPENAKDGRGFETVAEFDIVGLGAALRTAGRACAA